MEINCIGGHWIYRGEIKPSLGNYECSKMNEPLYEGTRCNGPFKVTFKLDENTKYYFKEGSTDKDCNAIFSGISQVNFKHDNKI